MSKRQANYQRDRDQLTREEEEDYEKSCEESLFRSEGLNTTTDEMHAWRASHDCFLFHAFILSDILACASLVSFKNADVLCYNAQE